MTFIVADPCVKCKHTDCVLVCPVDCFYEGKNMLVIHPDECIDCGACDPECPVTAIFDEVELPAKWKVYQSINAVYSGAKEIREVNTTGWPQRLIDGATAWPNIAEPKPMLTGAEEAKNLEDKLADLDPAPGGD